LSKNFPHLMEDRSPLECLKKQSMFFREPDKSNPQTPILFSQDPLKYYPPTYS